MASVSFFFVYAVCRLINLLPFNSRFRQSLQVAIAITLSGKKRLVII